MKFKEIKIGDTVFVTIRTTFGWNQGRDFTVPAKVERVTQTQFIIEGGRKFSKERGKEIGEHYMFATSVGEDQTNQMNAYVYKMQLSTKVSKMLRETNVHNSHTVEQLQELEAALLKFQAPTKI